MGKLIVTAGEAVRETSHGTILSMDGLADVFETLPIPD